MTESVETEIRSLEDELKSLHRRIIKGEIEMSRERFSEIRKNTEEMINLMREQKGGNHEEA